MRNGSRRATGPGKVAFLRTVGRGIPREEHAMVCRQCQQENPPKAKFCNGCGAGLDSACPGCGQANPPASRFCSECGPPRAAGAAPRAAAPAQPAAAAPRFASPEAYTPKHLAEKILTSRTGLEGERKHVTVLFADLKGRIFSA